MSLQSSFNEPATHRVIVAQTFTITYRELEKSSILLCSGNNSTLIEDNGSSRTMASSVIRKRPAACLSDVFQPSYNSIKDYIPDIPTNTQNTEYCGIMTPTATPISQKARMLAQIPLPYPNPQYTNSPNPLSSPTDSLPLSPLGNTDANIPFHTQEPTAEYALLDSIALSNFDLTTDQQIVAIAWMLEQAGCLTCLPGITRDDLINFVELIQINYNKTPAFHNFSHVFCITQMAYIILRETGLINVLSATTSTTLLIAAGSFNCFVLKTVIAIDLTDVVTTVCHDIDHEGLTNAYHIATESALSQWYNEVCPMENHHAAITNALLKSPQSITRNLKSEDSKHFRHVVMQIILATDMGRHDQILSQASKISATSNGLSVSDPVHLSVLLQTILKAADLSNELRTTKIADLWSSRLYQELNLELARLGRPCIHTDMITISKGQVDFLETKVLPIWTCMDNLISPTLGKSANSFILKVHEAIERHRFRAASSLPVQHQLSAKLDASEPGQIVE